MANLRFLTVEQTIADIAHFVGHLRATTPAVRLTTPVIVHGRDYAGSLAVWFHQRYPHLSNGVWGHRINVLSLQSNEQFGNNVADSLRSMAGTECFTVIENGLRGLEAIAVAGELEKLSALMNVCNAPLQKEQVPLMFFGVFTIFYTIVENY